MLHAHGTGVDVTVRVDGHVARVEVADPDPDFTIDFRRPGDAPRLGLRIVDSVADRWGVEMGSPQSMVRNGWRSSSLKPGDTVTVVVNPLKSGEFGGIFVSIVMPDGTKLGGRATD